MEAGWRWMMPSAFMAGDEVRRRRRRRRRMQRKDRPRSSDGDAQITRGQASSKDGHSTFKKMKVVSRIIYGATKGFAKAKH